MSTFSLQFDEASLAKVTLLHLGILKCVDNAIKDSAVVVQSLAQRKIQKPSLPGRIYRRGSRLHVASKQGSPPNTDTGRLVASIAVNHRTLSAEVGTNVQYAKKLEQANNRPFLQPSLEESNRKIAERINQGIARSLKG